MAETMIDLARYVKVKVSFFSKHQYETGDVLPVIPYAMIVKYDAAGRPTACHLRGYRASLPQHLCWLILVAAEKYGIVPLLKGIYDTEGVIVKGLPDSIDDSITLLEDLPFPPLQGTIQAYYVPYKEKLEGGAELWLLGGATVLGADLEKYYTIILDIVPDKWNKAKELVETTWPDTNRQHVLGILKPRQARLVDKRSVGVLVAARKPNIALLPLLN